MPTDLHALHARLLTRLDGAGNMPANGAAEAQALGAVLSGLAAALVAVRAELDREPAAIATRQPDAAPDADDDWTPPPVETVWGRAEWKIVSGSIYELCVVERDDYIARIFDYKWCAYHGPEGNDGGIDRGTAASLRDAYDQAIAALRAAGSLA